MDINSIKVKSFRTITSEQTFNLEGGLTLVGPNNCGKTNTLHAIMAFFTGYDHEYNYSSLIDLPFGERKQKTSLTCHFSGDPVGIDKDIFDKLKRLKEMLELPIDDSNEFSINVYFTNENPVYQVYPGVKKPDGMSSGSYSLAQKSFISAVFEKFQWYYIPSNKSIEELYSEFVTPFIKRKVAEVLSGVDSELRSSISVLTDSMNSVLRKHNIENLETHLEYPNNSLESFISGFDLYVQDQHKSSIFSKGMGLQAAVLLSSFQWITEQHSDKHVIWLIEEPETFMHPGLTEKCSNILDDLAELSTVIKTTHAINFIPSDISKVQGIEIAEEGNTTTKVYKSHLQATENIRQSLGVKFADYFGLSNYNIFVEGITDRICLEWIIQKIPSDQRAEFSTIYANPIQIRDMNGTTDLKGFIKANYGLIREEVSVVSLFDGDAAGIKAVQELSGYYGNKSNGYNSNIDYVILPRDVEIEGLFPSNWIKEAYENEKAWFEEYIVDAKDNISSFKIRDKSKKVYLEHMIKKAEATALVEWIEPFKEILITLDRGLLTLNSRLS